MRTFFLPVLLLCAALLPAENFFADEKQYEEPYARPESSEPGTPALARDYRGIALGMSPAEVKQRLSEDFWFNYRGEVDVSLLERPRASLIDAGGSLFIHRGLFQFEDNRLCAIVLELNPLTVDWFTVYTTLEERYGTPRDMNPSRSWWEDGETRLALERPLTVKYLDLSVYQAFTEDKEHRKAWREKARQDFLSEF